MADNNLDFKTVVPAAQAGDKAARDALMAAFYAWSVNTARTFVLDHEAAKNIAVSFWTWLFTKDGLKTYSADADKGAFMTWMRLSIGRIAGKASLKRRPKLRYYAEMPNLGLEEDDPTVRIGARHDLQAIADALPSDTHREVYWRLMERATAQEIADEIGIPAHSVRRLITTIRRAIQERLDD